MTIENSVDGVLYRYDESFWTGKRKLSVNGQEAIAIDKKTFTSPLPEGGTLKVKGTFLAGISLVKDGGGTIVLVKNRWWEWILIFFPLLNISLGLFCGAIGGFSSTLMGLLGGYLNALVVRSKMNIAAKIILCLLTGIFAFVVWATVWALAFGGLKQLLSQ